MKTCLVLISAVLFSGCASTTPTDSAHDAFVRSRAHIRAACAELVPANKQSDCNAELLNAYVSKLYPELK